MKFQESELHFIEQIREATFQAAELCIKKDVGWERQLRRRIVQAVNEAIWTAEVNQQIYEQTLEDI